MLSPEEQEKTKKQMQEARRQKLHEKRQYDEMAMEAFLLRQINDPYNQKLREAIRNRVESYSMSIIKASSWLMRKVSKMYHDVTGIKIVEVPEEFFNKTFARHPMVGTE